MQTRLNIASLEVQVTRKSVRHLRMTVCPPDARIEVTAPEHMEEDAIRLAIVRRLPWIKAQQREILAQARLFKPTYESGESHYFRGRRYLLKVLRIPTGQQHSIQLDKDRMVMRVYADTSADARERLLHEWYREYLKAEVERRLPPLAEKLGVAMPTWQIRRMRTCWGTCNAKRGSIILNLDLAMKFPVSIDYVIAHELCHFIEKRHNEHFLELLDALMPQWRSVQSVLNRQPLSYDEELLRTSYAQGTVD